MANLRDWSRSLQQASYKGVPFYWDETAEEGGRNPVVHVFPNRDHPYIEDLGEEPRTFTVMAYLHGNAVDRSALTFTNALASRGPGRLVLPMRGSVMVQALPFKRRDDKDKLGYVAYECKFIRDGATAALVSIPSLLNTAFGAVDALQDAALSTFGRIAVVAGVPEFVSRAAFDGLAAGAAAFDVARLSNVVDVTISGQVRDRLASVVSLADKAAALAAPASGLFGAARDLAGGMPPRIAVGAMTDIVNAFAERGR